MCYNYIKKRDKTGGTKKIKIACSNNHNHKEFSVITHVIEEKVDEDGEFLKTLDDCVEVTHKPNARDFIFTCIECESKGITLGEIATLYATVSDKNTFGYINIYNNKEEAEKEIGTIVDEEFIIGVVKGYSFKPVGLEHLYDEAPDFCNSIEQAKQKAFELGIELI